MYGKDVITGLQQQGGNGVFPLSGIGAPAIGILEKQVTQGLIACIPSVDSDKDFHILRPFRPTRRNGGQRVFPVNRERNAASDVAAGRSDSVVVRVHVFGNMVVGHDHIGYFHVARQAVVGQIGIVAVDGHGSGELDLVIGFQTGYRQIEHLFLFRAGGTEYDILLHQFLAVHRNRDNGLVDRLATPIGDREVPLEGSLGLFNRRNARHAGNEVLHLDIVVMDFADGETGDDDTASHGGRVFEKAERIFSCLLGGHGNGFGIKIFHEDIFFEKNGFPSGDVRTGLSELDPESGGKFKTEERKSGHVIERKPTGFIGFHGDATGNGGSGHGIVSQSDDSITLHHLPVVLIISHVISAQVERIRNLYGRFADNDVFDVIVSGFRLRSNRIDSAHNRQDGVLRESKLGGEDVLAAFSQGQVYPYLFLYGVCGGGTVHSFHRIENGATVNGRRTVVGYLDGHFGFGRGTIADRQFQFGRGQVILGNKRHIVAATGLCNGKDVSGTGFEHDIVEIPVVGKINQHYFRIIIVRRRIHEQQVVCSGFNVRGIDGNGMFRIGDNRRSAYFGLRVRRNLGGRGRVDFINGRLIQLVFVIHVGYDFMLVVKQDLITRTVFPVHGHHHLDHGLVRIFDRFVAGLRKDNRSVFRRG